MALSIAGKPKDRSLKKAKMIAQADFKWDYDSLPRLHFQLNITSHMSFQPSKVTNMNT